MVQIHWYRMSVKTLVFTMLAIMVMASVAYYQQRDVPKEKAPGLKGHTLNGNFLDLKQMIKQGPVLIYFWGSWCPYCRIVSPKISELARDYQVIGVAMQSGEERVVKEYMQKHNLKFPTINDPQSRISTLWGVRVTPTMIIVGSDGRVAWVTSGATSKIGLKMRLELTE
ncbi:protein disulfide oxidoreductase [uncultured Microbulbifer sp.]|uniref:protein disulfide oxidoreductase n=1 Tax=uncultured Microbulbifer sp. TaxID=348147 RepID=UPI002601B5AA|nr:protein disulfide oxidoreductase [uncultured Microbulbifer sp.]